MFCFVFFKEDSVRVCMFGVSAHYASDLLNKNMDLFLYYCIHSGKKNRLLCFVIYAAAHLQTL